MGQMAQEAANWLATTEGVNLLNGVLANVNTTLQNMKPGLADISRGFLELANQSSAFDVLSGAVNAFGESFRANVTSLIADGRLQSAFEGLKGVLSELARGFSDLVHNGIRVFAAAAPGIENFLNKLRDFFNRFDWERIGAAVGGVFDGLAETLSKIPQGTIDNITAAFERLSQTFQNPAIQQMFVNIISAAPMAINAINNMVQAFARARSFLTGLANAIQGTINVIGTAIQAAGDPVGLLAGKYSQAFSEAQAQIALGSTQIQQAFASLNQGVNAHVQPIPGQVGTTLGQVGPVVAGAGNQAANAAGTAFGQVGPAVGSALQNVPHSVAGQMDPVPLAVRDTLGQTPPMVDSALGPVPAHVAA